MAAAAASSAAAAATAADTGTGGSSPGRSEADVQSGAAAGYYLSLLPGAGPLDVAKRPGQWEFHVRGSR